MNFWHNPINQTRRMNLDEEGIAGQVEEKAMSTLGFSTRFGRRYFGGGGSKTKVVDPYAGTGVRELYSQLNNLIGPQLGQGVTPYSGQMAAGASPLQQAGFNVAQGLTPVAAGGIQYAGSVGAGLDPSLAGRTIGGAEKALSDILAPPDTSAARDYWNKAFVDPAVRNLTDVLLPQVSERYASFGSHGAAGSGAFDRAIGRTVENVSGDLNAQLANILFGQSESAKNRQLGGVQAAGNLAMLPGQVLGQSENLGSSAIANLLGFGGQQRSITQDQLNEALSKWQYGQAYNNPYLSLLGPALAQPGMDVIQQDKGPGWASLLGPLGMAAGGFLSTEAGAAGLMGLLSML